MRKILRDALRGTFRLRARLSDREMAQNIHQHFRVERLRDTNIEMLSDANASRPITYVSKLVVYV